MTNRTNYRKELLRLLFMSICFAVLFGFSLPGNLYQTSLANRLNPTPATTCPTTPRVSDYPANGPRGNAGWYANADRTIWATFWGWNFALNGPNQPDPKTHRQPGHKVLCYKPSDSLLTVTGKRIDGPAPALVYDISNDPRPRGSIQPSELYFPTAGCWDIDAKAGNAELRFVVLVKDSK